MTQFDFNHIDPRTGLPRIKARPEDDINLMSIKPRKSGWIKLLQNRINLNSTGNLYKSAVMWYDRVSGGLMETPEDKENIINWRVYRLPCGQYPQGWIYVTNNRVR